MSSPENNPLVSIITPSYNSENYISQTIQSVQSQTMKDWEMIIIDDHSQDFTYDICLQFSEIDSRIKVFKQKTGLKGAAHARNTAIEKANGRYIAFLDSDDLWIPDKLSIQLSFMAERKSAFSFSRYQHIDPDGKLLRQAAKVPNTLTYSDLLRTCPIGCLTAIYDAGLLGKQYMPDLDKGQDYALWLQILKKTPVAHGIDAILGQYRTGRPSLSSNKISKALSIWKLYREIENLSFPNSLYHMGVFCTNYLRKII